MVPVAIEIVGRPAGAARVEAGSDSVVDWKRPKNNSRLALTGGRGVGLEVGDTLLIQGGGSAYLFELIAAMGADPIVLHSWLGANGGGGHYRLGWGKKLESLDPGEIVYLPSEENAVLKIRGI